jgi:hypothetical protein
LSLKTLKKLASYFFLLVFLFNVGGYYLVFWGMQKQAKNQLLHRLDANNYSNNEVVVLTIPITLPYPIYQNGYERVDGEFEYKGEYFKLVKQKLENDTLFLVCIKDVQAKKLQVVMSDFSKLSNNVPTGSKQAFNFLSKIYKDFTRAEFIQLYKSRALPEQVYYAGANCQVIDHNYTIDSPPPELLF